MIETAWQNLRRAVRSLCRTPGFAVAVILTLTLGIGANTAIFSLLDAVMFKPLPVTQPKELFALHIRSRGAEPDLSGGTGRWLRFPYPIVQALEHALPPGASLAAMTRVTQYEVRSETTAPRTVGVELVSGRYFPTLGVSALHGRLIANSDNERIDAHPVAVISDRYWQQTLGGDSSVVGHPLRVNGVPLTIIGVAQAGFTGTSSDTPTAIWLPLMMQHTVHYASNSSSYGPIEIEQQPWARQDPISWLNVIVRAREGIETVRPQLEGAYQAEMRRLAAEVSQSEVRAQLEQQTIGFDSFERGFSGLRQQYATVLRALMALVALVLLIACANIANLFLVRAAALDRETRIRLSLGASRTAIMTQLLAEALVLTGIGTAAAVVLARGVSVSIAGRVLNLTSEALPPAFNQDRRVFLFAVCAGMVTTILFAVWPAFMMVRRAALTVSERKPDAVVTTRGMRPLIAFQVAIALLLVMTAAWFGRSLFNIWHLNPGFESSRLVALAINARNSGYTPEELPALYERLGRAARSVPGVRSAAVAECGLSAGCQSTNRYRVEGYDDRTPDGIDIRGNRVGAHYFSTIGERLLEGREFDEHDVNGAARVAIVTRSTVRRYFGGRSPLGKRIGYRPPGSEIIGVVEDARVEDLHADPVPMIYTPIAQSSAYAYSLDVRVDGEPRVLAPMLREAIGKAEPRLAIFNALPLNDRLERNVTRDTLVVYLTSGFGLLALLLASLGLYGVLAYLVAKRTGEIGIRMALGAQPAHVRRMVVADGMRVVLAGLALGVVATLVAGRTVESMLFDVSPSDPVTYGAVFLVLAVTALFACYLPARRASRVDPIAALRAE